jgi:transposase
MPASGVGVSDSAVVPSPKDRTRHTNRLRNDLREFFPAALFAFESLADRDTIAVLTKAPHPDQARRLSIAQIRSALRKGGRQRNLDRRASEIQQALRTPQLDAPPAVTTAFAATTKALVEVIAGLNTSIAELETELAAHFDEHPDADIYLSLPGLGVVLGARVLAEFGDDPDRYDNAKSRRNYAGTNWPRSLSPQHATVPSTLRAHECRAPAAIVRTSVRPATGVGVSRLVVVPSPSCPL